MKIVQAIDNFLAFTTAAQSPGTARSYGTGVRHFLDYLLEEQVLVAATVDKLTVPAIVGFIPWLYDYLLYEVANGEPELVRQATRANYLNAVHQFLVYLVIHSQLLPMDSRDFEQVKAAFAKAAKVHKREELPADKLPSDDIIKAMVDHVNQPLDLPHDTPDGIRKRKTLIHLRNRAMVLCLLSSGMRVGELVRLKRGDLLWEEGGAVIRYAKGGKRDREVLFSVEAWTALREYIHTRNDGGRAGVLSEMFVFSRHDRRAGDKVLRLGTRSVQNVFAQIAEEAGIAERFHLTPHTLRHWFGTEFLGATGRLDLTQYALGHSSPVTTRIYAQTKREDYREAHHTRFGQQGG